MSTIKVDLQANLVHITPDPNVPLALAEVPKAIKRAGFVPGDMTVQAKGTYEGQRFRIRRWKEAFSVKGDGSAPEGETTIKAKVDYSGETLVLERIL